MPASSACCPPDPGAVLVKRWSHTWTDLSFTLYTAAAAAATDTASKVQLIDAGYLCSYLQCWPLFTPIPPYLPTAPAASLKSFATGNLSDEQWKLLNIVGLSGLTKYQDPNGYWHILWSCMQQQKSMVNLPG